jgi:hypothetical protein
VINAAQGFFRKNFERLPDHGKPNYAGRKNVGKIPAARFTKGNRRLGKARSRNDWGLIQRR